MVTITGATTHDLRFPSKDGLDGLDAMSPDPVYSAACVVLETDGHHQGHGLIFTIGRGNEICVVENGACRAPVKPGVSIEMKPATISRLRH